MTSPTLCPECSCKQPLPNIHHGKCVNCGYVFDESLYFAHKKGICK